jgi:Fe-S oxidoreductase
VDVLEAAGFNIIVPQQSLCCGRPLYDFGMLGAAKHLLRSILDALRPEIEAGVPVVGLEPSCIAVFRDEMIGLFPHDEDARRLAGKTYLLSEFLQLMMNHHQLPKLGRKALVHGHCHQKAIMGMSHEQAIFSKLGLDYELLDSGCCGMAGSFGFEAGHYEISKQVGELVLLPAVRRASKDTLIVADGFSCREQIRQETDREALHTAQVLKLALEQRGSLPAYPERIFIEPRERERATARRKAALSGAAAGLVLAGLWFLKSLDRTPHPVNRSRSWS